MTHADPTPLLQFHMDVYFLSSQKSRPSLFGTPLLLPCHAGTTNQDLYRSVWIQVSRLVSPLPPSEVHTHNHAQDWWVTHPHPQPRAGLVGHTSTSTTMHRTGGSHIHIYNHAQDWWVTHNHTHNHAQDWWVTHPHPQPRTGLVGHTSTSTGLVGHSSTPTTTHRTGGSLIHTHNHAQDWWVTHPHPQPVNHAQDWRVIHVAKTEF